MSHVVNVFANFFFFFESICHLDIRRKDDVLELSQIWDFRPRIVKSPFFFSRTFRLVGMKDEDAERLFVGGLARWNASRKVQELKDYWRSRRRVELQLYLLFGAVGAVFCNACVPLFHRDIPHQAVGEGGRYDVLDMSLMAKYIPNEEVIITDVRMAVIGILLPIFFIIFSTTLLFPHEPQSTHDGLSAWLTSAGLSALITTFTKRFVGRLRPNFYDMCGFNVQSMACEASDERITEARKSFPSTHATLSFCGMTIVALLLLRRLVQREMSRRMNAIEGTTGSFVATAICFASLPLALAVFVASSRVRDNWHHPSDVLAGSIIGFACASFCFNLFFGPVDFGQVARRRREMRRAYTRNGGGESEGERNNKIAKGGRGNMHID